MQYSRGASNSNIMIMIWIFILAGGFAQTAKDIGAIDATVNLTLMCLPDNLLLGGIFIAACFISMSVGTSVGTIVALVPVVAGIADKTEINLAFLTAIVVGGAFFGDNLSMISDTTIAATRTQGCAMKDKFRVNLMIALPAAIIVLLFYIFKGFDLSVMTTYSMGGKIFDSLYSGGMNVLYISQTWNRNELRRWQKPGDITDVPRVELGVAGAQTDRYLIDASYFAIKNITFGYTFPTSWIRKAGLTGLRLYTSMDNLALFTHLDGMNPQNNFRGSTDYNYTPNKTLSVGLEVKF